MQDISVISNKPPFLLRPSGISTLEGLLIVNVFILAITGLAKTYSATGTDPVLSFDDPILGFSYRSIFIVVGMIELLAAGVIWFKRASKISFLLSGWLGISFLSYRVLWLLKHPGGVCPCMGTLTHRLHISPTAATWLFGGMAGFLVVTSVIVGCCRNIQAKNCSPKWSGSQK